MFWIFKKDPLKIMQKKYETLLEEAMNAQRNGKIEEFSELSYESEKLYKEIQRMKEEREES
tara:strand:+ start:369 stop:551 length:183 start_codon:yes stop_codon:yes gene_type:complete